MDKKTKVAVLLSTALLISGFAAGYQHTDNVKVYRGEEVKLGDFRFSYLVEPDERFEIGEEMGESVYIREQVPVEQMYDKKGKKYRFPEKNLYAVFEGFSRSGKGAYINLTVSSDEDIFSKAKMEADVPQRVIAAKGDDIEVPLTLENQGTKNTTYNLSYTAAEGIRVTYNYQGFNVSKIRVPEGEKFDISTSVEVLETATPGMEEVVFRAEAGENVTEVIDLDIRGSERTRRADFSLDQNYVASWPGQEFSIRPEIRNSGEAPLENAQFDIEVPEGWEVRDRSGRPQVVTQYDSMNAYYRVSVPSNVESGDYYVTVDAETENLDFESKRLRVHVRTKSKLSYIGVGLILVSLAGMGFTYRRLGRR